MSISQSYFEKFTNYKNDCIETEQNPGHSEDKVWFREMRIKRDF